MSLDAEHASVANEVAIHELLTRGVDSVYPSPDQLAAELMGGRQLHAYMGIDPTAPDMHVGHLSQLRKLERLQKLGHDVTLLIGDFTGRIGDPSDKSAARVRLTEEEVLANAVGYQRQASKVLDFEHPTNPVRLAYNSEWLGSMSFADVLELTSEFTVQQMNERHMFRRRIADGNPVSLTEFLYPVMQGWDSVKLGVDIEVGGSDQIFNMRIGSTLVKRYLDKQKYVIAGSLLVDPSGKKIGKTEGNMITLTDDPLVMHGKILSWGEAITPHALELCSAMPMPEVREIRRQLESGELPGTEGKLILAHTLVSELHSQEAATAAAIDYRILLAGKLDAFDINRFQPAHVEPGQNIVDILFDSGLAPSRKIARQFLLDGTVRVDNASVDASWTASPDSENVVLQAGKRTVDKHRRLTLHSPDRS